MGLPIKIIIKHKPFADKYDLKVNRPYKTTMMDSDGYYVRHPYNDEELHVPFRYLKEVIK